LDIILFIWLRLILSLAYKTQCSGSLPCQECIPSNLESVFDPSKDKRRKIALGIAQADAENSRYKLQYLIFILRDGTDEEVGNLRKNIEQTSSHDVTLLIPRLAKE
jgi:hypothetical protein